MRLRFTRRTTAGRLAPALLALLLCTAGGALAQTPASGLSAAGVSPTRATANSIYNFSVEWTKSQLPFAGRFITMQEPRLVKVADDGKSVQFRLPQFGGVDDHHEVWTAGGYAFEPLRKKRDEDATRAADELGELQPVDTQRARLTDQGKFDDPKVEDWRTVKLPADADADAWASDREIEVLGYFKVEPPAGEPPSATLQLAVTLGDRDGVWLNSLAAEGESIADTVHATNQGTITLEATDPALANGDLVWVRAHFGTQESPWLIEGWFPVSVSGSGSAEVRSVNLFAGDQDQVQVLGVFEDEPDSAENPDFGPTAAVLDPVTGLITITPGDATVPANAWVWLRLARQFQFDRARPSVTLRVAATPVVEKLTAGLYWDNLKGSENEDVPKDRRVFYVRATPVLAVSGVFNANDTADETNYYYDDEGAGGSYSATYGKITCKQPVPDEVTDVIVVYWVGPVQLTGAGGTFTNAQLPPMPDVFTPNSVPLSAALVDSNGTNKVYGVSGSMGMNLANDPHAAPGLWLLGLPFEPDVADLTWNVSDIETSGGNKVQEDDEQATATDALVAGRLLYGRFQVNANTLGATGPTVLGSRAGDPVIFERVEIGTDRASFLVTPPATPLRGVRGVWLDHPEEQDFSGTLGDEDRVPNYFTGGAVGDAVTEGWPITLGTPLPPANRDAVLPRSATVRYTLGTGDPEYARIDINEIALGTLVLTGVDTAGPKPGVEGVFLDYYAGGAVAQVAPPGYYVTLGTAFPARAAGETDRRIAWVEYTIGGEPVEPPQQVYVDETNLKGFVLSTKDDAVPTVLAVWLDKPRTAVKVYGTFDPGDALINYYNGGSFFGVGARTFKINLGTALPEAGDDIPRYVWLEYAYGGRARWGGGGSADRLYAMGNPVGGSDPASWDPLIAEQYTRDLAAAFIWWNDTRQFSPFNQAFPDDGTSSNTLAFRVQYDARDPYYLPLSPWMLSAGAVLYVKYDGQPFFTPYGMARENPTPANPEGSYLTKFEPMAGLRGAAIPVDGRQAPRYETGPNNYIAMPVGQHQYFFGASDDVLYYRTGSRYNNPLVQTRNHGTSLEPFPPDFWPGEAPDYVNTYNFVDRLTYRPGPSTGYSAPVNPSDPSDRRDKLSADQHPIIHTLLSGVPTTWAADPDILGIPDLPVTSFTGSGAYMGTVMPYRRGVHPSFSWPTTGQSAGIPLGGGQLIETCTGTSSTVFTFRVIYQSFNPEASGKPGRPPRFVKVFIDDTPNGTGEYGPVNSDLSRGATMSPTKANPTLDDYKNGLIYEYKTKLSPGSHTYYFEADSGFGPVRFPVRPDGRRIEAPTPLPGENPPPAAVWAVDAWVTGSPDLANNNDFCSGPFINTKPTLTNWSVTPASGPQGTEFLYKVTYTDADNQRPFQTDIVIQTDTGKYLRGVMQKVIVNNNNYSGGVEYQFRVSSVQAAAFAVGTRRYRFEFTDDWGRATDLNDLVQGEIVQAPLGSNGAILWVDGPTIAALGRPQLFDAGVSSADGTSNGDTNWTYSVRYVHGNNSPPSFVNLYIGSQRHANDPDSMVIAEPTVPLTVPKELVQVRSVPVAFVTGVYDNPGGTGTNYFTGGAFDAGTGDIRLGTPLPAEADYAYVTYSATPIVWDAGHPMVKLDPSDNVYTDDGVVYKYETRLPGPDDAATPIRYYYTFQSSDGRFVSVYNPASSPGAFALTRQSSGEGATDRGEILSAVGGSNTVFGAVFAPAVGPLPDLAASNPGVLLEPLVYVYAPGQDADAQPLLRQTEVVLEPGDAAVSISADGKTIVLDGQALDLYDIQSVLSVQAYDDGGILQEYFDPAQGDNIVVDPTPPARAIITVNNPNAPAGQQQPLPGGVRSVFISYLTKGDYRLSFATSQVFFNEPVPAGNVVEMEYWWAQVGPEAIGVNSPPSLANGSFTPDNPSGIDGNTRTPFTFGVVYTDTDGPQGQAPQYIRVVIDGVEHAMTMTLPPDVVAPDYSQGVLYTYTTALSDSAHRYYFVASDGTGFAVFDADGSTSSGSVISDIRQIPGPVVTEQPVLTNGTFTLQQEGNNKYAFEVTYAVKRNAAPSFIYLLIGRANSGQKQVTPTTLGWGPTPGTVVMTLADPATPGVASPKLLGVVGVWTNPSGSGINYYTGGSFDSPTGLITLGSSLPAGTTSVYVTYYCTPITWAPEGPNIGRIPLVKKNPLENTYSTGVVYTTQTPLTLDGPGTGSPATDPSRLYYYAFEASDGVARAEYRANGSGSAYDAEAEVLTPSDDLRTFSMGYNGYSPSGEVPADVLPSAVVGPLDPAAGGVPLVVPDPVVTLTDTSVGPGSTQTLIKGDGAHKTQYKVDYATGRIILGASALESEEVKATYWFARPLPLIPYNVPPSLTQGRVLPLTGSSASTFTYTVNYSEPDGTPPTYVEVVIDGTPYAMTRASGGPEPDYADNISYQYQTNTLAPAASHNFYFRASDGIGYAVFDGGSPQSRNSTGPITVTLPISGPAVSPNNTPTLTNAQTSPSTALILPDTQWTFQVTYSDIDNDAPGFVYLLLGQATAHSLESFNSSGTGSVVVTPVDSGRPGEAPPKLLNVVGVWDNPAGSGTNYYTGGTFDAATGLVTLGNALPASAPVYVTYHATPVLWTPEGQNRGRIELVKLDPSDSVFTDGAIYTTSATIKFDGPASGSIAADPPKLNFYAFEASDGIARATYTPAGARPSPSAYGADADALVTGDRQTYQMTLNGFPTNSRPDVVSPVIVGPLFSGAGSQALVLEKPVVTLTPTGGAVQTLTPGDLAVKTQYEVDYALGRIRLGAPAAASDAVRASYWFAQPLPMVQYNAPPRLTGGRVSPEVGSRHTTYTYTVTYTETDGLNGTAPAYVRVVIDGTPYRMTATVSQPIFRNGVEYRYQTTLAPNAAHRYYFEASDGYGYAVFDALPVTATAVQYDVGNTVVSAAGQSWTTSEFKNAEVVWYTGKRAGIHDRVLDNTANSLAIEGLLNADAATAPAVGDQFKLARSRSSLTPFANTGAIEGPFINDAPYLTDGVIEPGFTIRRNDPVTYQVAYHDSDNDAPATGYPIAWIGGEQWEFNGGIMSQLRSSVTLISDSSQSWTPSLFKGQPLTWITGKRVGITDTILDNTSTMLILSGRVDSNVTTRPEVSDRFGILQSNGTASAIDYRAAAFVDDTKSFTPDALAGRRVQMVTGSALGAVFDVVANTAQVLAISGRQLPTASADPDVVATGVASGDSYSIHDILVGQVTLSLNDNGYVSMLFRNSPGWEADQFAGLVIQMMSGTAVWKKYTILSNTADTLYFAQQASVFVSDGVSSGSVARIAGLKMDKLTAGDNDYTVAPGVAYTVTIPGLGPGYHTVRWMAANSPLVRGIRTTYQGKLPSSTSLEGPFVSSQTPPGNSPPVLVVALATPPIGRTEDNYSFSVRYLDADGDPPGPHDGVNGFVQLVVDAEINGQIVRRTYRSSVDPVSGGVWPVNVFRTIDPSVFGGFLLDASVSPLPPGAHRFHFEASDGWSVVRYPSNAADDPMVVVNSAPRLAIPAAGGVTPTEGNTGTTFRFRVVYTDGDNQAPTSVSVLLTKNGVAQAPLVMTQEVPSDVNYADGASYYVDTTLLAGNYTYHFIASDPVEAADPTVPRSGPVVRGANNSPVLLEGAVTPAVSPFAANAFTYSVRYRDQDNDSPNRVQVTIYAQDGTTVLDTLQMAKANPDDNGYSGARGVLYEYPGYHFGESGSFFYQFSASDGTAATGDVGMKSGPVVNTPPVLSAPGVDMMSGASSQLFTFTVTYTDADDLAPTVDGYVRLVLTSGSTVTRIHMEERQAAAGWSQGKQYEVKTQLVPGTHSFYFEASDGLDPAANTPPISGLTVIATPGLRTPTVTPSTGMSTDTYIYRVTLANPSGNAPDEILVFIDGTDGASAHPMTKTNPADMNFAAGVEYRYATALAPSASMPGGLHTWFIRATVAGQTVYPPGQGPSTPARGPFVNSPPALSSASVNPTFGRPLDTPFTFQVTCTDADRIAPGASGYVRVVVSGVPYVMSPPANPDWTKPVVYTVTTQLPGGQHTFHFEASDGIETARMPSGAGEFDGPRVSTRPSLTNGAVTPATGTTATVFTYSVTYSDPEGDAPAANGVQVLIDGQPYVMTRVAAVPNYVTGAVYTYTTKLGAGSHNFMFQASDGIDLVTSELQTGKPTVDEVGLTVNVTPNPAALGSVITVSGEALPRRAATLNVVLDRPTGANVARTVTTDSSGAYSFTFVTDEVGTWDVTITDPATNAHATISPKLTVSKATLRVQGGVVDMISSPVSSATGDPSAVFGGAAALALNIVKWMPAAGVYRFYGVDLDFPVLGATSGFWIKPAATTTLELTGTLRDQTQPIAARVTPGWNQIGSGFVKPVNWADIRVQYGTQAVVSLAEAESRGWVRGYAWGYDPLQKRYILVRGSGGESTTLDPFRGYWVRSFVECDLLIQPPSQ